MNFDKTLLQEFNLKSFRNAKNAQLNIGKDVGACVLLLPLQKLAFWYESSLFSGNFSSCKPTHFLLKFH